MVLGRLAVDMGQFGSLVTAVLYYHGNFPDVFPFGLPALVFVAWDCFTLSSWSVSSAWVR